MSRTRIAGTAALALSAAVATSTALAPAAGASTYPTPAVPSGPYAPPSAGQLAQLRGCESGGNYSTNTGNGFYGAYQFDLGTWQGLGLPGRPDQAPAAVQDRATTVLEVERGWQPWPACSAKLGLGSVHAHAVRRLVPHAVLARLSDSTTAVGQTTSLYGVVEGYGRAVLRQQSYDGVHWATYDKVYSAASGGWHFAVTAGTRGVKYLRVMVPASAGRGTAVTPTMKLQVS